MRKCLILLAALCLFTPALASDPIDDFEADVDDGLTLTDWIIGPQANNAGTTSTRTFFLTNAFTTTNGSPTVTVSHTSHGKSATNAVIIEGGVSVGGLSMDGTYTITSVVNANSYTITHGSNATSSAGPTGSPRIGYPIQGHDGKLRVLCEHSHFSYNDPLVRPGEAGVTHLHAFFGNTLTDHNSTYATLRATGTGTCEGGPVNRSAYWMPALINTVTLEVLPTFHMQLYYVTADRSVLFGDGSSTALVGGKTSLFCQGGSGSCQSQANTGRYACSASRDLMACPQLPIQDIVRGQAGIFGMRMSDEFYFGSTETAKWACTVNGVTSAYKEVIHDPDTPSNGLTSLDCGDSGDQVSITVRVANASCWNGESGWSGDHYAHFADGQNDGGGQSICPATHPRKFMSITFIAQFAINTTGQAASVELEQLKLSSDYFNGATWRAGASFHADAIWAWNRTVQLHWHENAGGMLPAPRSWPYTYNSAGMGYVGGLQMQEFQDGTISNDCTELGIGITGNCRLKTGNLGNGFTVSGTWADNRTSIPSNPYSNLGRSRMK
jgi:hypothetical protein